MAPSGRNLVHTKGTLNRFPIMVEMSVNRVFRAPMSGYRGRRGNATRLLYHSGRVYERHNERREEKRREVADARSGVRTQLFNEMRRPKGSQHGLASTLSKDGALLFACRPRYTHSHPHAEQGHGGGKVQG